MRVTIGKAVSGDVRRLADLWTSLHKFHERLDPIFRRSANSRSWWIKFARETMSSPEGFVFVAKTGGRPVGYVLGSVKNHPPVFRVCRYGMISDMFVSSRFRGRGVGGMLAARALSWFKRRRIRVVEMQRATANADAGMFWRKMGFRPCAERGRLTL